MYQNSFAANLIYAPSVSTNQVYVIDHMTNSIVGTIPFPGPIWSGVDPFGQGL
ncbi:hypothetical protein [Paenibacillus senegalensis]|uniref:hypothetical protein n=1 Tax=Paenibacillus senegalensis TaxID=1465766 RepID=UPI0002E7C36B|nr:hypothetical protein [Paenibacillus senegalensis]